MSVRLFLNPRARSSETAADTGLFSDEEYAHVEAFFEARPEVQPTPLRELPGLAPTLGVGRLFVKDESARLGLNAFKGVGVLYAVSRLLESGRIPPDATLVCATQGNHGRAVAHVARRSGLRSRIYVPANAVPARVDALRTEGAEVVRASGGYDAAVAQMRAEAEANQWVVVSDTAWPGYEQIPRWIMCGYTRIMTEVAKQLPGVAPDLVVVQAGVGGLAGAVASWLRARLTAFAKAPAVKKPGTAIQRPRGRPRLIVCEPLAAPCLMETAGAGRPVQVPEGETIMAGLCAGRVSSIAWPAVLSTADAFVAIDDSWAARAMAELAAPRDGGPPVIAGASGAAGLGALLAMRAEPELRELCMPASVDSPTSVLLINTEGATDPALRQRILGRH